MGVGLDRRSWSPGGGGPDGEGGWVSVVPASDRTESVEAAELVVVLLEAGTDDFHFSFEREGIGGAGDPRSRSAATCLHLRMRCANVAARTW